MPDENENTGTCDGRIFEAYDAWSASEVLVRLARNAESYEAIFVTPRSAQEDPREKPTSYFAAHTCPLTCAARRLAEVLAMYASIVEVPTTDAARLFELRKQRVELAER